MGLSLMKQPRKRHKKQTITEATRIDSDLGAKQYGP
jgi:hypothetical protein